MLPEIFHFEVRVHRHSGPLPLVWRAQHAFCLTIERTPFELHRPSPSRPYIFAAPHLSVSPSLSTLSGSFSFCFVRPAPPGSADCVCPTSRCPWRLTPVCPRAAMENAYTKSPAQVLKHFQVSQASGLSDAQVARQRAEHGRNGPSQTAQDPANFDSLARRPSDPAVGAHTRTVQGPAGSDSPWLRGAVAGPCALRGRRRLDRLRRPRRG